MAGTSLYAANPVLSPRAQGNAVRTVAVNNDISVVDANAGRTVAPRALGNEIKTVAGISSGTATTCSAMKGSPKAVAECASHPSATMSCCRVAD